MKNKKIIIGIVLFFTVIAIQFGVKAKDYSIEEINMNVTLNSNGNLDIREELTYKFDRKYNGIYITIPYGVNDSKYDQIRKQTSLINDSFYNADSYKINGIFVNGKEYKKDISAYNGMDGIYTVEKQTSKKVDKIKVYSPSNYTTKKFIIDYTLNNVAVKHNDIGEVYYNFIGGSWDKTIKKLNIDINLPNNKNKDKLYAFAHGPENGKVTIKDSNNINLYVKNVRAGEYVAGRILFDLNNIQKSNKVTNKTALSTIMQEEKNIYNKVNEKYKFNNMLLYISIGLLLYWLLLILKYEKDKKYDASSNDEEMFEKYNPLIAGCIQENRNVLPRDIIAVILELVNKKYLKLEIRNHEKKNNTVLEKIINNKDNKIDYDYILSINNESEYVPDEIEKYILNWIDLSEDRQINLLEELKSLPRSGIANEKFEELDNKAMDYLNKIGANKAKVPWYIRALNTIIFIFAVVSSVVNIMNSAKLTDNFSNGTTQLLYICICLFPLFMYLIIIPIKLFSLVRKSINKVVQKINGQKIVSMSVTIILIFLVIMVFTFIISGNQFLLVSELLIGISTLIMLTDNLMTQNDPIMIEDFSRLNALKYKIENYSMMKNRDIKEIILWERYLTYAISFGIANKIAEYIRPMMEDRDIVSIMDDYTMADYIMNDYSYFTMTVKSSAVKTAENIMSNMGSGSDGGFSDGGFSGGSGGGFYGGGGFSGGGGSGRRRRSFLEQKEANIKK